MTDPRSRTGAGEQPGAAPRPAPAAPVAHQPAADGAGKADGGGGGGGGGGEMVRSEEQLRVRAVNVAVGRARLVTYIVTEEQTFTIPVSRQEVRLVFDPVPASEHVVTGTPLTEEVYEVVRHAEQVLFTKQIVPVERVRMIKTVVTTAQTVTTAVQSEQLTGTHHDRGTARTDTGTGPAIG